MKPRLVIASIGLAVAFGGFAAAIQLTDHGEALAGYLSAKIRGGFSLEERMSSLRPKLEDRLRQDFNAASAAFPPSEVALLAFKDQRQIEVYARSGSTAPWQFIKSVPVLGLSGQLGPKLREGDYQVPEGLYRAEFLNPNGRFHVSIRLNYPNAFDRLHAQQDGRSHLGGDIMIHGTSSSVGCLAVGNRGAEELFFLAGLVSKERVRIIVSPTDFRSFPRPPLQPSQPVWLSSLYEAIQLELASFPSNLNRRSTRIASDDLVGRSLGATR